MAPQSNHLISKAFLLLVIVQAMLMVAKCHTQIFSQSLHSFQGAELGQTVEGLKQMKKYLKALGYYSKINYHIQDQNYLTDYYDDSLEFAVKTYQQFYRLETTGKLDTNTINKMMAPRCGFADISDWEGYFSKWSHRELTYTLNSSVQVLSVEEMSPIIARAFRRWADASGLTIEEALSSPESETDMVLGFQRGDHGDGEPFYGPLGQLAHSTLPENGRICFDADEDWTTTDDPDWVQTDFESVATHEIGHLLGLLHSRDENSVMYASYPLGKIKRDLRQDDINRIQELYNG